MSLSVVQGFTKSLAMTILSEIGDKTFFAAAVGLELLLVFVRDADVFSLLTSWRKCTTSVGVVIAVGGVVVSTLLVLLLALLVKYNDIGDALSKKTCAFRLSVALIVMTILSVLVGWAAPNLLSRKWAHHITTFLFFGFGLWSLWDAFKGEGGSDELAEVEAEMDAAWKTTSGKTKDGSKDDDDLKKQMRPFMMQLFSPIFLKAFSITFFGEWGDKSQLATIGLAADENPFGVVFGGIIGQALCTTAAVLGGKSLASQISEKIIALSGGVLFIVFGIQSFMSTVHA